MTPATPPATPARTAVEAALILASGSPYRAEMLARLGLPFSSADSGVDETPEDGESPDALVRRLAVTKASQVARKNPGALVVGADQVAVHDDRVLGKPGNRERAIEQLEGMSGGRVEFLSGIALVGDDFERVDAVPTVLVFRPLARAEIERYVDRDRPFDCAGAMRSESLGIALLESLTSDDPSALIGLPLIRLSEWLREAGLGIP
ncbi:MAG: nucleoside triphosphate pyrophosphatase [Wenzhouxiangellaceae bacterium]|nr:nucleoside triphosphate pyrophosphatase [Wenzhouxiangellaceae bacterium]